MEDTAPKRLRRSRDDRKIAGVLGGVAEYLEIDPSLVRIAYAVITLLTGVVPGLALYVLMVFIVPVGSGRPKG